MWMLLLNSLLLINISRSRSVNPPSGPMRMDTFWILFFGGRDDIVDELESLRSMHISKRLLVVVVVDVNSFNNS